MWEEVIEHHPRHRSHLLEPVAVAPQLVLQIALALKVVSMPQDLRGLHRCHPLDLLETKFQSCFSHPPLDKEP